MKCLKLVINWQEENPVMAFSFYKKLCEAFPQFLSSYHRLLHPLFYNFCIGLQKNHRLFSKYALICITYASKKSRLIVLKLLNGSTEEDPRIAQNFWQ